jgi:hypothetical protein
VVVAAFLWMRPREARLFSRGGISLPLRDLALANELGRAPEGRNPK